MKICFVTESIDYSKGSGRFAHSMIKTLRDNFGVEPVILMNRGEKVLLEGAKPVLFVNNKLFRFIINPTVIAWYSRKADLIHAFDGWPYMVLAYLASRLNGKKYSATLYGTYAVLPLRKRFQGLLLRRAYDNSAFCTAISTVTAQRIKEAYPPVKVEVILQGIDYSHYQNTPPPERIIENDFILTVATMKKRKGYHISIPVFAKLKKDFPDLKYVILATRDMDNYVRKITELMRQLGVGKDIIWLERVSENELISLYKNAKVFFVPSISLESRDYFEGFGSVYLEAQSCGLPVVTSQGGGQEEALIDNKTGFLIREGDIEGYHQAVKKLLSDGILREKMSQEAKKFAESMDWKNNLKKYYERYKEIIAKQ